jgi:hypothetical protein
MKNSFTAEKIAQSLQKKQESFYNIYNKQKKEQTFRDPRAIILILDRKFDLISPLIHNYTYQSCIYDFLNINIQDNNIE